jgi:hypothetical protein
MGSIDPIALAEAAEDALDRFGELTECAEFGYGWSCTRPTTPDGPPRIIGRDDRGCDVWMQRWQCVAGHWYDLETAPDRNE